MDYAIPEAVHRQLLAFDEEDRVNKELYLQGQMKLRHLDNTVEEEPMFLSRDTNIQVFRHHRYEYQLLHCHNFLELWYVYDGTAPARLGDSTVTLREGDFYILAPHLPHVTDIYTDDCTVFKIFLRRSTFERLFFRLLSTESILSRFFRQAIHTQTADSYLYVSTRGCDRLRFEVVQLYLEFSVRETDIYRSYSTEGQLLRIFCTLLGQFSAAITAGGSGLRSDEKLRQLLRYIDEHYRTVTLGELSARFSYSPNYLCRLLKKHTGSTLTELQHKRQLDECCTLLCQTDLPIRDIAAAAGFQTVEYFTRLFRSHMGCAPGEYRRRSKLDI